jgi:hypothetical protein
MYLAARCKPVGLRFDFRCRQWGFLLTQSFQSRCSPEATQPLNRSENQRYLLGIKGGQSVRLTTLPLSYADAVNSGSLNLLEPQWLVQACLKLVLCYFIQYAYLHMNITEYFDSKRMLSYLHTTHHVLCNACAFPPTPPTQGDLSQWRFREIDGIYVFEPRILIYLCNKNQQNAHIYIKVLI